MGTRTNRPWVTLAISIIGWSGLVGTGCDRPDLTVLGHDIHLSQAAVRPQVDPFTGAVFLRLEIVNVADPCFELVNGVPDTEFLDDTLFEMVSDGPVALQGPATSEAFEGMSLFLVEDSGRGQGRSLLTSGNEIVEGQAGRFRLDLMFTHEGVPWEREYAEPLDVPIPVELDIPYTICDD
jgi:hypothetical protein